MPRQGRAFERDKSTVTGGAGGLACSFKQIVRRPYPAGFIGLRLEKCRYEETLSIRAAYETAVRTRVMRRQTERRKGKPCLAKRGRVNA